MNDQPPIYIPQPPGSRQQPGGRPIVLILVAIPFAICFLILLASLTYLVFARSKPRERPGTRLPVTFKKMAHGWNWYYLRTIGVAIACTAKPSPIDFDQKKLSHRSDISEYSGYRFLGRHLNTRVFAYWMRNSKSTVVLQSNYTQRSQVNFYRHMAKVWQEPVIVGGLPGRMVTCEYQSHGYPTVTKTAILVIGNISYFFEGSYYKKSEKWAKMQFSYELRTAHIDQS